MLQLTQYQEKTLESLCLYLQLCDDKKNANTAFYEATLKILGKGIGYNDIDISELKDIPYVCLRLPTGGGKTLLACHSISVVNEEYLRKENSVVLWLVPSNAIKGQTIDALKNKSHPYRQALDSSLGQVTVMDIQEALYIQESTLAGSTTIIVSTLQAFRVEEKEGRRVYSSAGALEHHFTKLPAKVENKLPKNGNVKYSLANVLRINRLLVIVDEAHNARTVLSFDTLAHFRPSAIIEFIATPDKKKNPSNVLHSVSAAELKAENMIKLPIRLSTKSDWKSSLADAISQRSYLEDRAQIEKQKTGEYIRPLMLLQTQNKHKTQETLDVDKIEKLLVEEFKIPKNQIAVATGSRRELDGIDLQDPDCQIRFVITVQALMEGWDCPFAYVLCSVNENHASTRVEQILGRILRLPACTLKNDKSLNKAYAFITSDRFAESAKALIDALIENGFNQQEASDFIQINQPNLPDISFSETRFCQPIVIQLPEVPSIKSLPKSLQQKIKIDSKARTLTVKEFLEPEEKEIFKQSLVMESSQEYFSEVIETCEEQAVEIFKCPAGKNILFQVPQLYFQDGDLFDVFEEQTLLDYGWELSDFDARLTDAEYFDFMEEESEVGEIDIQGEGQLQSRFISELNQEMMLIDIVHEDWTEGEVIYWLDRNLIYYEITPQDKEKFLTALVGNLIDGRKVNLAQLVRKRFKLRKIVDKKIKEYKKLARGKAYQELLFGEDEKLNLLVSPEHSFNFKPEQYPARDNCPYANMFKNHYYPTVGELDGKGEEFECAQFIDNLEEIEFWVRNLERQPNSLFWLQTSTDKFYPDFVCQLKDGRTLVVEYKGADRWSNDDSKEKRRLGELWEAKSNGKCLFIMPNGYKPQEIKAKIQLAQ